MTSDHPDREMGSPRGCGGVAIGRVYCRQLLSATEGVDFLDIAWATIGGNPSGAVLESKLDSQ